MDIVDREDPKSHFVKRVEKYNHSSNWVGDTALIEKICALVATDNKKDLVLDIGTGTGKIAQAFHKRGNCVIGIDICMDMARQAKDCADRIILSRAEGLPFKSNIFDVCVCRQGLQFMDIDEVIFQIHRVLKPKGRVVLCHLSAYGKEDRDTTFLIQRLRNPARKNFFLPDDFLNIFKRHNFVDIESFDYISRESINQWIDNSAINKKQKEKIREVYRTASVDFKRIHNVEFNDGDILDSMKMVIVKAKKNSY